MILHPEAAPLLPSPAFLLESMRPCAPGPDPNETAKAPQSITPCGALHLHHGASGARTRDLRLAKPALSQLSYGPVYSRFRTVKPYFPFACILHPTRCTRCRACPRRHLCASLGIPASRTPLKIVPG